MASRKLEESIEMRAGAGDAVEAGTRPPAELQAYFEDNGWKPDLPTAPTLKVLLQGAGVVLRNGRWMLKDE